MSRDRLCQGIGVREEIRRYIVWVGHSFKLDRVESNTLQIFKGFLSVSLYLCCDAGLLIHSCPFRMVALLCGPFDRSALPGPSRQKVDLVTLQHMVPAEYLKHL